MLNNILLVESIIAIPRNANANELLRFSPYVTEVPYICKPIMLTNQRDTYKQPKGQVCISVQL